MSMTAITFKQN